MVELLKLLPDKEMAREYEKELEVSSQTMHKRKRKELLDKWKGYPPTRLTKSEVVSNYETHRYDMFMKREEEANQPGGVFKSTYEMHSLFTEDGKVTYGIDCQTGKMGEAPLRYSHVIKLEDFEECLFKFEYSDNVDLFSTMHNLIDRGIEVGLDREQFRTLLSKFVREEYKFAFATIKNEKSPDVVFERCLDMVNFGQLAVRTIAAIRKITRAPEDDLTTVVYKFRALRTELYGYQNTDWSADKCREKAETSCYGIIRELVEKDTYTALKIAKDESKGIHQEMDLKEQLDFCTQQEMMAEFALTQEKNLKKYDPSYVTDTDSQIRINAVRAFQQQGRGRPKSKRLAERKGESVSPSQNLHRMGDKTSPRPDKPFKRQTSASPLPTSSDSTASNTPNNSRPGTPVSSRSDRNREGKSDSGKSSAANTPAPQTTRPNAVPSSNSRRRQSGGSRDSSSEGRACYLCSMMGHTWRSCHKYRGQKPTENLCSYCQDAFHEESQCMKKKMKSTTKKSTGSTPRPTVSGKY